MELKKKIQKCKYSHPSWLDLKSYYCVAEGYDEDQIKTVTEVSVENIGYDTVLQCLLLPACEAFLCNRKFCEIFYERIYKQDIMMREFEKIKNHKNKDEYREMNAEYLIEILIDALFTLRNDEFSFIKRPEDGFVVI